MSRRQGGGFWSLWSATTISGLGDGIRITAFAVFAATLSRDPLKVSLVTVASYLPWLLVGPFTGTLVDRLDRRRTLWICDALRALMLAGFAIAIVAGQVGILVLAAVAFLLTSVETLADNLSQALTPNLTGDRSLTSANTWLQGGQFVTTEFCGAPVGAALLVIAHTLPFVIDAVSFAVSAALIFSLRVPGTRPAAPPLRLRALGTETLEGIRWLCRHRVLRTICLLIGLGGMAAAGALAIAVLYSLEVLHVSRTTYGLLMVVIAAGGLLGLIVAPRATAVLGNGRTLQLAFALRPLAFLIGALTSNALVAALGFVLVGASISLGNVVTTTLRQTLIPAELFGRVNGAYRLVVSGMAPFGGLLGGALAGGFGLRAPFFFGAALSMATAVAALGLLSNRVVMPLLADAPGRTAGSGVH